MKPSYSWIDEECRMTDEKKSEEKKSEEKKSEEPCRCGGIGICQKHPERYVDGRYVGVSKEARP